MIKEKILYWITPFDPYLCTLWKKQSGFIVVATSLRQAQNIYRKYVVGSASFHNYESRGYQLSKTHQCVNLTAHLEYLTNGVDGILQKEGIIPTDEFTGWKYSGINQQQNKAMEDK